MQKRLHSYLSPKCEVKKSTNIHGQGVFAREDIKKGKPIAFWGGYIITLEELDDMPEDFLELGYPVQIYPGFFLGPKNFEDLDDAEMFNHSCDPNAGVKGQNILVARLDIKAGEEICFDYETTNTEGLYFKCCCGSKNCRRIIDGTSWKDPKFQRQNQGYLSWYIQEKIKKNI